MATPLWRDPTGPLEGLAEAIGLDKDMLPRREFLRELSYPKDNVDAANVFPSDPTERLKRRMGLGLALSAVRERYGPALTFEIRSGGAVLLDGQTTIDQFHQALGDSPFFDITLKIDKDKLISHWGFGDPAPSDILFLFTATLESTLALPLTDLDHGEEPLFAGDEKVVLLIPERNIALDGRYLSILGGDALLGWQCQSGLAAPIIDPLYGNARDKLNWVNFNLERLAPSRLDVDGKAPDADDPIAGIVYAQLLICSLLYMASQSRSKFAAQRSPVRIEGPSDGKVRDSGALWVSRFEAEKSAVKVEIPDATKVRAMLLEVNPDDPWQPAKTYARLVGWIYGDASYADGHLIEVQSVVAHALEYSDPSVGCRELVRRASDVAKGVDWAWRAFTSKELETYFAQVKQLDETIDGATKSYNEQVETLTKSLTDNMLAAVAVVIGSFIAAVVKSPFESEVFAVGTGLYAVYLLIFPMGVGLVSTWQRFRDFKIDFAKRIEHFSKGLPRAQVDEIVGRDVENREHRFQLWFGITVAAYVLVAVALVAAAVVVPGRIRSWSDRFELTNASYGRPGSGTVPMTIRGESFHNDKEIVVTIGSAKYTNTDEKSLKVLGSTVLTLAPRQEDLKQQAYFTVQQGSAPPLKMKLPASP